MLTAIHSLKVRNLPKQWEIFFGKIGETLKAMGQQGLTPEEARMLLTGIDPKASKKIAIPVPAKKESFLPLVLLPLPQDERQVRNALASL